MALFIFLQQTLAVNAAYNQQQQQSSTILRTMSDSTLITSYQNMASNNNGQYQIIHLNQNDFNRLSNTGNSNNNLKQQECNPTSQPINSQQLQQVAQSQALQQQQQILRSPLVLHNQQQQQLRTNFNQNEQFMLIQGNQTNQLTPMQIHIVIISVII